MSLNRISIDAAQVWMHEMEGLGLGVWESDNDEYPNIAINDPKLWAASSYPA